MSFGHDLLWPSNCWSVCACSVICGTHARTAMRRHRAALCSSCVECAVRRACLAPEPGAQSATTLFAEPRQLWIKHAAVSSMLHLHPANPPPNDFAGLRRGFTLAWRRHTGHAFPDIPQEPMLVWRKPSGKRAGLFLADSAVRCVNIRNGGWSWTKKLLFGSIPKYKPDPNQNGGMGTLV